MLSGAHSVVVVVCPFERQRLKQHVITHPHNNTSRVRTRYHAYTLYEHFDLIYARVGTYNQNYCCTFQLLATTPVDVLMQFFGVESRQKFIRRYIRRARRLAPRPHGYCTREKPSVRRSRPKLPPLISNAVCKLSRFLHQREGNKNTRSTGEIFIRKKVQLEWVYTGGPDNENRPSHAKDNQRRK